MSRFLNHRLGLVLLAVLLSMPHGAVNAQQPRTRTLTYDADRKEWVEQPPPSPGTPEGDLHAIRVLIKDADYRKALTAIKKFVKRHGESDSLYPEVLIAKAEALIGRLEYYTAHVTLQAFLGEFAGVPLTSDALRMEFNIAEAFLSGVRRKVWGIRWLSGEDIALRILDEISADYPDSRLAELAIKTKADYLFKAGDHALAELEYTHLLRDHPQSRYHQYALRRSAEGALASFGGVDYDEAALIEAEERYRDYQLRYPDQADRDGVGLILDGIRELRAEKDFLIGAYYERTDHWSTAIYYYRMVRENWPDTIAATKAASRLELLGA
ncbi:MAG: outer membrane protein assembly factor BamD [Phycisphaerae bacterium]